MPTNAERRAIPLRVWIIASTLALIEPVLHLWLKVAPPEGAAHTRLRVPDTNVFLHSMTMFETNFRSAYVMCEDSAVHGAQYYAAPGRWMLGVLGWATGAMGLDPFMMLGIFNGLGMFLYLIAVFLLLREAVPHLAKSAFTLFALAGGLGGVLFLATGLLGLHGHVSFESVFLRYAHYELFTGAHLQPHLNGPYLYYTLPLALVMLCYTMMLRKHIVLAAIFMLIAAFINVRFSAPGFGIALIYLWLRRDARDLPMAAALFIATAIGGAASWSVFRMGETGPANVIGMANIGMWATPFLSAAFFHIFTAPFGLRDAFANASRAVRCIAFMTIGYLIAFAILFIAYQIYFGNIIVVRDAVAAMAVSDWAIPGAFIGLAYGVRCKEKSGESDIVTQWFALWFLITLVLAIGAFAGGLYLRLTSQRLMVFLAVPLAVVSAHGLSQWRNEFTKRIWYTNTIGFGIVSILVSSFWVQGPLGGHAGQGPYGFARAGLMSEADGVLTTAIPNGAVAAPLGRAPYFGDIIAHQPGNHTVIGAGTVGFSNLNWAEVYSDMAALFAPDTEDDDRRTIIDRYCLDYIYCPDTTPVDEQTIEAFTNAPWLEQIGVSGNARLFEVHH